MSKHLLRLLMGSIGIVGLIGLLLVSTPAAFAASTVTDPTVVIAVDMTHQFKCVDGFTLNVGTSHAATIRTPCSTGRILQSQRVPLSRAQALHEGYIFLPSGHASQATITQFSNQLNKLMRAKQGKNSITPNVPCGSTRTYFADWYPGGDEIESSITWYKHSDCTTLTLDRSTVTGYSAHNPWYWNHNQYQGGWWGTGCPFIGTNSWYSTINAVYSTGYYFQTWIDASNCGPFDTQTYVNIGPLS